jgi:ATPase subunit of ABC transporter with duplicated ATPase domains
MASARPGSCGSLTGESESQRGTVVRPNKIGVLRQDHFAFGSYRVLDTVIMGNRRLWEALAERRSVQRADLSNEDGMRLGELEGIVGEEDGYSADSGAVSTDIVDFRVRVDVP